MPKQDQNDQRAIICPTEMIDRWFLLYLYGSQGLDCNTNDYTITKKHKSKIQVA